MIDTLTGHEFLKNHIEEWLELYPSIKLFIKRFTETQISAKDILTIQGGTSTERRVLYSKISNTSGPVRYVDCSKMPVAYTEGLIFGFNAGFMGWSRTDYPGYLEKSEGGTLVLDHIEKLDLDLQTRLSQVLNSGTYRRLGTETELPLACRIICGSNYDLSLKSELGQFKEDFYFRISSYSIEIPELKNNSSIIDSFIALILKFFSERMEVTEIEISYEARELLRGYSFPGGFDELFQILKIAADEGSGTLIIPDLLAPFSPVLKHLSPTFIQGGGSKGVQDLPGLEEIEILNYVNQNGHITNTHVREILSVDRYRASYLLKKLDAMNILDCAGKGRSAYYTRPVTEASV